MSFHHTLLWKPKLKQNFFADKNMYKFGDNTFTSWACRAKYFAENRITLLFLLFPFLRFLSTVFRYTVMGGRGFQPFYLIATMVKAGGGGGGKQGKEQLDLEVSPLWLK